MCVYRISKFYVMTGKDTRLLSTEFYFWYVGGKYQIIAIVCEHGDRNNTDGTVDALCHLWPCFLKFFIERFWVFLAISYITVTRDCSRKPESTSVSGVVCLSLKTSCF